MTELMRWPFRAGDWRRDGLPGGLRSAPECPAYAIVLQDASAHKDPIPSLLRLYWASPRIRFLRIHGRRKRLGDGLPLGASTPLQDSNRAGFFLRVRRCSGSLWHGRTQLQPALASYPYADFDIHDERPAVPTLQNQQSTGFEGNPPARSRHIQAGLRQRSRCRRTPPDRRASAVARLWVEETRCRKEAPRSSSLACPCRHRRTLSAH